MISPFSATSKELQNNVGQPNFSIKGDANWVKVSLIKMRVEQSKLTTVKALQSIGFDTIASGDSYNDLGMIQASKAGFLFRSTDKIKADYPDIPAYETYEELLSAIRKAMVD